MKNNSLNRVDIVVAALCECGGAAKAVDTEDIAMRAAKLSPGTFSWKKYPQQINLESVAAFIRDAKKEKFGFLVIGSHRSGWRLSEKGVRLAHSVLEELNRTEFEVRAKTRGSSSELKAIAEIERVKSSTAYAQWKNETKVELKEIKALLKVTPYTSTQIFEIKKTKFLDSLSTESEMKAFLDHILPLLELIEKDL